MLIAEDAPSYPILEQASGRYTAVIVGEDEVTPIPGSTLTTLVLTLYVIQSDGTDAVVNGRNQQNVLNANDVTVDESGNLVWHIRKEDTTLVEDLRNERHIALFEWRWPTNAYGKHELVLVVKNLHRVT